jgi:hypothetical protein
VEAIFTFHRLFGQELRIFMLSDMSMHDPVLSPCLVGVCPWCVFFFVGEKKSKALIGSMNFLKEDLDVP